MAALVTAALVPYLSGMVTGDVGVSSPISVAISEDGSTWVVGDPDAEISLGSIHGGESITFFVRDTNDADVPITGITENRVTNVGVTCDDFESVMATTTTNGGTPSGPYDLIELELCSQDGEDVVFSYGPDPNTWAAGQEDISEITVTFKANAFGDYVFTSQVLPEVMP